LLRAAVPPKRIVAETVEPKTAGAQAEGHRHGDIEVGETFGHAPRGDVGGGAAQHFAERVVRDVPQRPGRAPVRAGAGCRGGCCTGGGTGPVPPAISQVPGGRRHRCRPGVRRPEAARLRPGSCLASPQCAARAGLLCLVHLIQGLDVSTASGSSARIGTCLAVWQLVLVSLRRRRGRFGAGWPPAPVTRGQDAKRREAVAAGARHSLSVICHRYRRGWPSTCSGRQGNRTGRRVLQISIMTISCLLRL
jgi:hypothetical protein